ncbi:phosphatidate cytidylyltransferase [Paenibacillus aurantius]|uniref:Phosphatidate cytidylyltransferase n=1 Tax=Paenibacillus aurantius TaxID=2918900 RepID=A0AA96RHP5_9BACL|nr:phosphatidate cytidylyltransferase [Paenibacillus aurantius]WNQ13766.1 phosphatidate cytidylyltransferase [Paenibacillus aurantius]
MQKRLVTGIVAGAAFIGLLLLGGYWYGGLIALLALIGYNEYLRMNHLKHSVTVMLAGLAGLVCLIGPSLGLEWGSWLTLERLIWVLMFLLLSVTVISKNKVTLDQAALVLIGVVYIGLGFAYMIVTRMMEPHGLFWTLLIFLCIWSTDSGAYFTGRAIGKHPLWPAISPNKTVEGALGGVVISIIVAVCFHFGRPDLVSLGQAVVLGAVIAVVGQLGDLIQSAYKRVKGIKDTGTLLPGHGGVLDRVDSWLIVFPFLHLFSLLPH